MRLSTQRVLYIYIWPPAKTPNSYLAPAAGINFEKSNNVVYIVTAHTLGAYPPVIRRLASKIVYIQTAHTSGAYPLALTSPPNWGVWGGVWGLQPRLGRRTPPAHTRRIAVSAPECHPETLGRSGPAHRPGAYPRRIGPAHTPGAGA